MVRSIVSVVALGAALSLSCMPPASAVAEETPAPAPVAETIRIQVLGAVAHPGNIEMHPGDRLSLALARAGAGDMVNSDLRRIHLIRGGTATDRAFQSYEINAERASQHGDQRFDPVLRTGDKIYVPQTREYAPFSTMPTVPTG
jgi:protein involved in polysaccharide export with SLBB domain